MTSDDHDLDSLLAGARAQPAEPSVDLLARVLADAYALQPAGPPPVSQRRAGWAGLWAAVAGRFGGGAALAGLVTAGAAGLMIGLVQPAPVSAFTGAVTNALVSGPVAPTEVVELIPSFNGWMEGGSDG